MRGGKGLRELARARGGRGGGGGGVVTELLQILLHISCKSVYSFALSIVPDRLPMFP